MEPARMETARVVSDLAAALNELADLIEARGDYYYEEVEQKLWIAEDDA